MKQIILYALSAVLAVSAVLMTGCVREELPDNRDTEYGYVQFKLYKEASYQDVTKAVVSQLDSLSQASKISVQMINADGQTIIQALTLSSYDVPSAEFGLRSAKLRLLKGDYQIVNYTLYDNEDKELYIKAVGSTLTVTPGGLEVFDLTANVAPRGMLKFNLVKDLGGFVQDPENPGLDNPELNRASVQRVVTDRDREYTFDEIATVTVTLVNLDDVADQPVFSNIPVVFEEHFRDEVHYDGKDNVEGFQTSSCHADSIVYAPAGRYKIYSYELYDGAEVLLERQDFSSDYAEQETEIVVEDNRLTEADVPVTLVEADEYLQDNYALFILWKALHGEEWSYEGESWPKGSNWNFNKDPDLWCDQPGVQVHQNGRIASIDLSGFGFRGDVPAAIGQFDELVQLSFGNHNEISQYLPTYGEGAFDPQSRYPVDGTDEEKAEWRENRYRAFAAAVHPAVQMSPACALALRLNGVPSNSATAFYDSMSDDEIARMAAGSNKVDDFQIRPYDMNKGKLTNGLTSIHENIRNLTRLESLTIANAPIEASGFPSADAFAQLSSVTELTVYNCPNLTELPDGFARMGNLTQINISNNGFSPATAKEALAKIADGASEDVLQIIYFMQNDLEELPEEVGQMGRIGMLDVSENNIKGKLPEFGDISSFTPEEVYLDNYAITEIGNFCPLTDLSTFSASNNKLESFPNFFTSDEDAFIMGSINLAHNNIKSLPDAGTFKGVRVVTLTLSGNPIRTFPKELAETDSYVEQLVMQQCGMENFPKGCLDGKFTSNMTTLDFQYNKLDDLPEDFNATTLPYLYGIDLSSNAFSKFPWEPLNTMRLTAFAIRGQRDEEGERCLREWPTGLYQHTGLRGFYIGSNNLGVIDDTISEMIFYMDISDNPNITFDASDICAYWEAGAYYLYYDESQEIIGCDTMTE